MSSTYRTHSCGAIRPADSGSTVTLSGWVNNYRDHGGVRFVDLRDRDGLTQVVFHPEAANAHETAQKLRHEDVITVTGKVVAREGGVNKKLATGEVEVDASELKVLNKSLTPPFTPDEAGKVGEEIRLRHRYLDMRRPRMQEILRKRHRVTKTVRDFCDEHGFLEIETPFLCRSTPEGARDFLVPSRLQAGSFYALPQSPQLFKQLLMVGGAEKYVQIVRCFRDEDPRADRQAEFTQVDLEMSFVDQEDVIDLCEDMIRRIWKDVAEVDVPKIQRMPYAEAMARFGSDRPDLRFGMELVDVTETCRATGFKVFDGAVTAGGAVKLIRVPGGSSLTRKQTDALAEFAKGFGGGGLPVCKVEEADGNAATRHRRREVPGERRPAAHRGRRSGGGRPALLRRRPQARHRRPRARRAPREARPRPRPDRPEAERLGLGRRLPARRVAGGPGRAQARGRRRCGPVRLRRRGEARPLACAAPPLHRSVRRR